MRVLEYHSDTGCRRGCHPVSRRLKGKKEGQKYHYFSVDEPGAWWKDEWNCHVDGCDHPCRSREEAILKGASVLYDSRFDGNESIIVIFSKNPLP